MTPSLTFFTLISGLLSEANEAVHQATELSADQPILFIAPQIDVQLKCVVIGMPIEVAPSNAAQSNYYGSSSSGESLLTIRFKLKP